VEDDCSPLSFESGQDRFSYPSVRGYLLASLMRAKHIGTTDRMALLLDETFEMLVMAQYNIVRHGGVDAIEVSDRGEHTFYKNPVIMML
jgi:hypothetical protein